MTLTADEARMMRDDLTNTELSLEGLEAVAAGDPSIWSLLYNFFAPHSSGTAGTAKAGPHGPTYLL